MTNPASEDKISNDELREIANIIDPHAFAEIRPDVEEPFRGMIEDDRQLALSKAGRILSARTQLASRQVGVTVKPLEWEPADDEADPAWEVAETIVGRYAIEKGELYLYASEQEEIERIWLSDEGDLRTRAQTDYEQRILAALQPSPEPAHLALKERPSAWLGYWPGAGSINSVTKTTHSVHIAAKWRESGAEVTELFERPAHPAAVADKPEPFGWHNGYGQLMLHADREALRGTTDEDMLGRFDASLYAAPLPDARSAGRVELEHLRDALSDYDDWGDDIDRRGELLSRLRAFLAKETNQ